MSALQENLQPAPRVVEPSTEQLGAYVVDRNDAGFDASWHDGKGWPNNADGSDRETVDIDSGYQGAPVRVLLKDRKGGDMAEWPEDLRVREFPR